MGGTSGQGHCGRVGGAKGVERAQAWRAAPVLLGLKVYLEGESAICSGPIRVCQASEKREGKGERWSCALLLLCSSPGETPALGLKAWIVVAGPKAACLA